MQANYELSSGLELA